MDRNTLRHAEEVTCLVALRKESVDRNSRPPFTIFFVTVALRKESVDRNLISCIDRAVDISRSPQGERG